MCWDGNRWLFMCFNISYGVYVLTSSTGFNWTTVLNTGLIGFNNSFKRLLWTGTYYIVGGTGTSGNIARSLDGITWTMIAGFFKSLYGIAYNGYMLVATGDDTTLTAKIKYSLDQGATWISCSSPSIAITKLGRCVATNDKVWVVGYDGGILYSLDGKTFMPVISATFSVGCFDIVWNGTLFVAVGTDSTSSIKYSYDGITWVAATITVSAGTAFKGVSWNGSLFITVVSSINGQYYSSKDGIVWTAIGTTNSSIIGPRTIMFSSNVVPDFQVENLGIYGKGQPPLTTSTNTIALYPSTIVLNNTITVSQSGFVGVNCNAPKVALDVNGTLNVSGTTTLSNGITVSVPSPEVTSFIGNGVESGKGSSVPLNGPHAIASSSDGTMYVADYWGNKIRKVTPAGVVTTFAGTGAAGFADGSGNVATFSRPSGIAVAPDGTLYISDLGNKRVRKITPAGVVSTVYADDVNIWSIVIDSIGNLFYSTDNSFTIKKLTLSGTTYTPSTFAGLLNTSALVDATGTAARFLQPYGISIDASDNIYVADKYAIRQITPGAVVTTIAGSSIGGTSSDGIGSTASFQVALCVYCDLKGNLYVSDANSIRKIVISTKVVTTVTGSATAGFTNGVLPSARFNSTRGITMDSTGNLFVCDLNNNCIRKIGPTTVLTTNNIIGNIPGGEPNMLIYATNFSRPYGVLLGTDGKLYIFETIPAVNRIGTIDSAGIVEIYAGRGGEWNSSTNGTLLGNKLLVNFNLPLNGTFDPAGNLYVCDTYNHIIRRIDGVTGSVTTIAGTVGINGNGNGYVNATGTSAKFYYPEQIAYYNGALYVADRGNHAFRKIDLSDNSVTTFAGPLTSISAVRDGYGTDDLLGPRFNNPSGIYFSSMDGCFYITDWNRVCSMTTNAIVNTIASGFGLSYGIVQDVIGNLYVCDSSNNYVNKITRNGIVSIVISILRPTCIAIDSYGNLFVSSSLNGNIYKISGVPYSGVNVNIKANSITVNGSIKSVLNGRSVGGVGNTASGEGYDNLVLRSPLNMGDMGKTSIVFGSSHPNGYYARIYAKDESTPNWGGSLHFQTTRPVAGEFADAMTINNAGNVGIGTTAPSAALHVTGTIIGGGTAKFATNGSGEVHVGPVGGTGAQLQVYGKVGIGLATNVSPSCALDVSGYIQITESVTAGTSLACGNNTNVGGALYGYNGSSAVAINMPWGANISGELTLSNATKVGSGNYRTYNAVQNGVLVAQIPTGRFISITAEGYIQSSWGFIIPSDERIKKNIEPVTDALDIVNKLGLVSYDYIDFINQGNRKVRHGLIAQELQKVYPEAVNITTGYIPSVYKPAASYTGDLPDVTITTTDPHNFSVNDKIRLYIIDDSAEVEYNTNVLEVLSDTIFTIKAWDKFTLGKDIFIYGKKVNDFLAIDKPLIGLIAAGACKTLSQQVSILQQENLVLRSTINAILQKYPI